MTQEIRINPGVASPLPRTTPTRTRPISSVTVRFVDGTKATILVEEDQGFYRESSMKGVDAQVEIQEVFITNGKIREF